jgi:hypothetical protein
MVFADIAKRNVRCIKCEMKKLKSQEVSEVGSSVDASVLQELRDEITVAKSATDEAKDAASKSVPPVLPVGVSVSEGIDSDWMKKDLRCIQYEIKKLQRKTKETVVSLVPEGVHQLNGVHIFLLNQKIESIRYFRTSRRDWSGESISGCSQCGGFRCEIGGC